MLACWITCAIHLFPRLFDTCSQYRPLFDSPCFTGFLLFPIFHFRGILPLHDHRPYSWAIDSHDPFEPECPISYVYLRPRNFAIENAHEDVLGLSSPGFHFLTSLPWVFFYPRETNTPNDDFHQTFRRHFGISFSLRTFF